MSVIQNHIYLDFFFKCALSLILGFVIGYEREARKKPAGIKTHSLICLGSTIFTYLSIHFASNSDPARIAAQIVTGIGFIGAGTIFVTRQKVKGLTSAANIWAAAAIGMLIGRGFSLMAFIAVCMIVFLFHIIQPKSSARTRNYSLNIEVIEWDTLEKISELIQKFELDVHYKTLDRTDTINIQLNYAASSIAQHLFMKKLFQLEGLGQIIKI